jgi:hypothetical protein
MMSLSYFGDVRFKYGAENKDKIANILTGNYERILDLYKNTLKKSNTL